MKIFRNSPKDIWLIIYTLAVGLTPFAIIASSIDLIWWTVILPFQAWSIANLQNAPLHHHSHWSTFNNKTLNKIYEVVLSAVSGIAHENWKQMHLTHHIHVNDRPVDGKTKDPISVFKNGKNGEVENFWSFCFTNAVIDIGHKFTARKKPASKHIFDSRLNTIENVSWIVYFALIFLADVNFGCWMMLVYFAAHFLNYATSYGEHWGVLDRRGDTTQDSVGIYSRWYNWIGFGAGYHQEHHNKPGVHWTKLHTLTPKMHPDRRIVKTMHIFNAPYWSHFKLLFRR
jgi:hypothetical protein